jgi:polyisoprenoid-binding protein YceI
MIATTAVAAGTYAIDATRSRIRFHATHAFGLGPVDGTFAVRDGTITVAADAAGCAVTARVDAASFTTDKARRDADVRSKRFLHTQDHPDMRFVSERLTHDGDRWLLHGTLTVRGTSAPATLELAAATTDPAATDPAATDVGCRFHARTRIDRYAHHVGPRGIIGRYVDVEFDIVGTPVP